MRRKLTLVHLEHSCRHPCSRALCSVFVLLDCDGRGEPLDTDYNRQKIQKASDDHDREVHAHA